ncbi:hypothetical protein OROHE_017480 [Orobanche hederae]
MRFIGDEICYRANYYLTIDKLFAARADLHRCVYTHAKVKFYNEYYVVMDKLEKFRNNTAQDIVYSQQNGGVSLREEDVVVNNVQPDLTCGRHSLLVHVFETPFCHPPFDFLQLPTAPIFGPT